MNDKEWWLSSGIKDEYPILTDRNGHTMSSITREEYTDSKGIFYTIEYSMYDDFDNTIFNTIVFKSRRDGATRKMFRHYVELFETMDKAMDTYNKYILDIMRIGGKNGKI